MPPSDPVNITSEDPPFHDYDMTGMAAGALVTWLNDRLDERETKSVEFFKKGVKTIARVWFLKV